MPILNSTFETTLVQVDEFQKTGQPRPTWLQRKVDAIYLSETDPERGLAMLIDGLRDEKRALTAAKYKRYPNDR